MKRTILIYMVFVILCTSFFYWLGGRDSDYASSAFIVVTTLLASVLTYIDYRARVPLRDIVVYIFALNLVNSIVALAVYFAKSELTLALVLPFFMAEGAFVAWKLEQRLNPETKK